MRKSIISKHSPASDLSFLDLEHLVQVEFSSENLEHPVESALLLTADSGAGWQAASPGEQTIRIVFDQARTIEHIVLIFDEQQQARSQEFVLLWLRDNDTVYREILRQQFNFSPPHTTQEIEHYELKLNQLKGLELRIIPSIGGGEAYATLKQLRLA